METENTKAVRVLYTIVNAGYADDVMTVLRSVGVAGGTIFGGRGQSARHESILGISVDFEKEIIMSVVECTTAKKAMAAITEQMGIKSPAHGVCFTVPVEELVGLSFMEVE